MATIVPTYYKRYRMTLDLHTLPSPQLPAGFQCLPWTNDLLEAHAAVLYASFHQEIDALIFPSFANQLGCVALMAEISRKRGFVAGATWLLIGPEGPCGSVQGIRERTGLGAIQNLGVLPGWRSRGLGRDLLLFALRGFQVAGLERSFLEVTAQNEAAIRLYRRLGFRRSKVLYKAVGEPRLW